MHYDEVTVCWAVAMAVAGWVGLWERLRIVIDETLYVVRDGVRVWPAAPEGHDEFVVTPLYHDDPQHSR